MLRELETYVVESRLVASPLRLGEWLIDKFGEDIVTQRRARERAISALDIGAPVALEPLPRTPTPLPSAMPPPDAAAPTSSAPAMPKIPPAPFLPVGLSDAVDRAPSSIVGASVDVTPSQLPVVDLAQTERGARARSTWLLAAIVGVVVVAVVAIALMRAG
jgi:serine/threonine-protein kinase